LKYIYILISYWLCLSVIPVSCQAQEENIFNLNIDNGLPSNHVYGAITDKHGYLWVATPKGIARYNGYDFKLFNLSEGLPYEDIWELLEDKKGRIWLGNISSEIGYIYNNKYHKAFVKNLHGTIYPRNIQTSGNGIIFWSYYISGDQEITICKEKNDTFYTTVLSKTLFKKEDQKNGLNFSYTNSISYFFIQRNDEMTAMYGRYIYNVGFEKGKISANKRFEIDDSLFILTFDKYYVLNGNILWHSNKKPGELTKLNFSNNRLEKFSLKNYGIDEPVEYIHVPKDNNPENYFYIITTNFILQFQESDSLRFIKKINKISLINGSDVTAYNKAGFWGSFTGTSSNGIYINISSENHFIRKNNLDLQNFKYIGGLPDQECFWWNKTKNTLLRIGKNLQIVDYKYENLFNFTFHSIIPYKKDSFLLMGTYKFVLNNTTKQIDSIEMLMAQDVFSGIIQEDQTLALITSNGLLYGKIVFNKVSNKFVFSGNFLDADRYRGILYDSIRQNIWAYNYDKVYIHKNNKKDSILTNEALQKFGVKKIESICIDNKYGNIFFKGQNNITIYNPEKNAYTELFKDFNLKESSVYIYNNTLIVVGRFGIIFNKILNIDKLSKPLLYANIKNKNYNYIYDCQISWGKLLLNTDKGVYEVKIPSDSEIINSEQDSLFYKYNVILNYKDSIFNINTGDTIQISQKDFRLQFDIINPEGNGQLKYTYKLPNDTIWHELNANELSLPMLAPDNYYKITLTAHDNVWRSDNIDLILYIKPYWWQTHNGKKIVWSSIIILTLLFLTALILITRKLVLRANKKRNLQMELELKSIYAQINPHFIFNTLNSALLLVSKNKMEEAYVHIAKFSRLLRSYIKSSRNKLTTIADEISNLRNYIDLQQTRFKDKFNYSIVVDENMQLSQLKIPSLLLQPFVENAINHGILNKQSAGNLSIEFKYSDRKNEIICIIDDDGIGRKQSKLINETNTDRGESYGDLLIKDLINIFNKYEHMNIEISYTDKEAPLTGTIVSIKIKKTS